MSAYNRYDSDNDYNVFLKTDKDLQQLYRPQGQSARWVQCTATEY